MTHELSRALPLGILINLTLASLGFGEFGWMDCVYLLGALLDCAIRHLFKDAAKRFGLQAERRGRNVMNKEGGSERASLHAKISLLSLSLLWRYDAMRVEEGRRGLCPTKRGSRKKKVIRQKEKREIQIEQMWKKVRWNPHPRFGVRFLQPLYK